MWNWLQGLTGGAANFIGSLTGSLLGLLALLIGAMFNAHLNRRRDDRLRREEARAIAAAVQAELAGLHRTLIGNAQELSNPKNDFVVPDIAHSVRRAPELLSKLGLLDVDTIRSVIDAYVIVEQYGDHLVLRGGKRGSKENNQERLIALTKDKAKIVVSLNEASAVELEKTMRKLDRYLV